MGRPERHRPELRRSRRLRRPNAAAGSLPFLSTDCLRVLRSLKDNYGSQAWGRYGFCDAFHPAANWYDPDVLGIDLGISVLMAENLRTRLCLEHLRPQSRGRHRDAARRLSRRLDQLTRFGGAGAYHLR
jgi:hypothetical protein